MALTAEAPARVAVDLEKDYVNDLFTREAEAFITRSDARPFFLYLNYTVPHAELRVPVLATPIGEFRGSVLGFLRETENLIILLGAEGRESYRNVYGARSLGVEAAASWTSPRELLALDTEGVPPTSHAVPMTNVLRADDPVPSFPQDEMLANAPDPVGMLFRVPRIIEE